jgi:hypothetical protein
MSGHSKVRSSSGPLNSISLHSSRSQLRTAGAIGRPEGQSPFIFDSKSSFKGSSDAQPLALNSTVEPSWCLHLKRKFMAVIRSKFHTISLLLKTTRCSWRDRWIASSHRYCARLRLWRRCLPCTPRRCRGGTYRTIIHMLQSTIPVSDGHPCRR